MTNTTLRGLSAEEKDAIRLAAKMAYRDPIVFDALRRFTVAHIDAEQFVEQVAHRVLTLYLRAAPPSGRGADE